MPSEGTETDTEHPLAVPISCSRRLPKVHPTSATADNSDDPMADSMVHDKGCKLTQNIPIKRNNAFIFVLLLIIAGLVGAFVWKMTQSAQKIGWLERQNHALDYEIDILKKKLTDLDGNVAVTQTPADLNVTTAITKTKLKSTSGAVKNKASSTTWTMTKSSTTDDLSPSTEVGTITTVAPRTAGALPTHGFEVLQTNETIYSSYSFLAVQVRVPSDGMSVTENWCRDYENLCKQFGRKPTGCGSTYTNVDGYEECADLYNSDMNIGNVLGCGSAPHIANAVNAAFSHELSPPAIADRNTFGFNICKPNQCKNTIRGSEHGLYKMADFWEYGNTTMYTLCR